MVDMSVMPRITSDGKVELDSLDNSELLTVLVSKINLIDNRIANIEDGLNQMATRHDIELVIDRLDAVEGLSNRHDAWIRARDEESQRRRAGLLGRVKEKAMDYTAMIIVGLVAAAIIGGIAFYIGDSMASRETRRVIDQIKTAK